MGHLWVWPELPPPEPPQLLTQAQLAGDTSLAAHAQAGQAKARALSAAARNGLIGREEMGISSVSQSWDTWTWGWGLEGSCYLQVLSPAALLPLPVA